MSRRGPPSKTDNGYHPLESLVIRQLSSITDSVLIESHLIVICITMHICYAPCQEVFRIMAELSPAAQDSRRRGGKASEWSTPVADPLQPIVRLSLQIVRGETGMFGNTRQHLRPDLFTLMKCKGEVRPARTSKHAVRGAGLSFDCPTNAK